MNSLNLLSHIGNTPPPSPQRSRRASEVNLLQPQLRPTPTEEPNDAGARSITSSHDQGNMGIVRAEVATYSAPDAPASEFGEKTPLLSRPSEGGYADAQTSKAWLIPRRIAEAAIGTVRVLFTAVLAPGRYVIACFYEEDGQFSILTPLYKVSRAFTPKRRKAATMPPKHASDSADSNEKERRKSRRLSVTQTKTKKPLKRSPSVASTSTAMTSDSEMDSERPPTRDEEKPSHHTRTRSTALNTTEEIAPAKRSIRIKLHNEEALRQRRARKSTSRTDSAKEGTNRVSPEAAAALKSPSGGPTSLSAAKQLTRFPRAPQPPRPLVPRRQPSYSTSGTSAVGPHQKTLILDLDETLIHSMTKSTRYSSGHMIEVKLQTPVGAGGQIIGPQVPILYFVHERPHCYDFLKKVCSGP
jgi:CTD nuclear envelope phosphatase 1